MSRSTYDIAVNFFSSLIAVGVFWLIAMMMSWLWVDLRWSVDRWFELMVAGRMVLHVGHERITKDEWDATQTRLRTIGRLLGLTT